MVSLRSGNETNEPTSSRSKKAAACLHLDCGLLADSSSVASSNSPTREEFEASEKTDQVRDLSPNDYSDSEVNSDEEEISVESTQTSVIESESRLVDQGIIIDNNSQATALKYRISKSLGPNQHKRKRLDDGDTNIAIIVKDSNREGSSLVHRRTLRKAGSFHLYLEIENPWMNKTSRVVEKSIKDCRAVISLLGTGKLVGEVGGNNTIFDFTEAGKLLGAQEQLLVNLQLYIQRCGGESKIAGNWQREK
ncbi:hypothetical protein VE03_06286 [Pseudogymnoascus sp. 23342-1-I1]|nr:hypothetical protein VE03_06286 [Pseudogymnoascus sp. 23342-1-I1]